MMNRTILIAVAIGALLATAGLAQAEQLYLGTADGGMMVYYNNVDVSGAGGTPDGVVSGYDENSDNQAFVTFQFGYSDTDGMGFQFSDDDLGGFTWNSIFSGLPVGSSQFGLDLLGYASTYNPAGGVVLPSMDFVDNVDNTVANAAHTNAVPSQSLGAWAINDYKGGTASGPGHGGAVINSVFRGLAFTMNVTDLRAVGTTYEMDVEGELVTDGLIHWYNPATGSNGDGTSDLSSWTLGDTMSYSGTLIYDMYYAGLPWGTAGNTYGSGMENGSDQMDFYAGSLDLYVEVIPEPATMGLLALGLSALVARRRRK